MPRGTVVGQRTEGFHGWMGREISTEKSLVRVLKGDRYISVRANNIFLRINMVF